MKSSFTFGLALFLLAPSAYGQKSPLDLGTLGGRTSVARDINQTGVIVGEAETAALETHAFIWQDGVMKDLGVLHGKYSMANGLNNLNQVVGYAAKRGGGAGVGTDAVIWDDGKISKLPSLPGAPYSQASELNDKGEIVGVSGMKAVVWRKRKAVALPSLGGSYAIALGINEKGWIIGNSANKEEMTRATLWKKDKAIDLGTLGGRFSTANGINDAGVIVGSSETADGKIHGFLWSDGVMKDLGPGMARSINNQGWIAGELEATLPLEASVFLKDEKYLKIDLLHTDRYSSGFAVNAQGKVVGITSFVVEGETAPGETPIAHFHATLWE